MLNKAPFWLAASALVLGLMTSLACGGGKEIDVAAVEITDEQLAQMMLSLEDYGPDFRNFELDKDSGPSTAEEDIENDFDPEGEAEDIERFGWASGYEQSYTSSQSLQDRSGIFSLDSGVVVFDAAEGAAGYLDDLMAELDALPETLYEGLTVEDIQRFDADVADQAYGFHFSGVIEAEDGLQTPIFSDTVMHRRGRLMGWVSFTSYERQDSEEQLRGLARQLDQRIVEVLEGQAQAQEEPERLVMRPGAVLATSGERFTQEVKTFQGVFHSTIIDGGSRFRMTGDFAFRSPDTVYMTMEIMGETMDFLVVAPDIYVRLPGRGWRVITDESIGLDRDALERYLENRGPVDYAGTTAQLENLTQLPDETLDGVTCLHYQGTLDIEKLMDELPEGIYDPAVLEQVRDFWEPVSVEVWLDKESYLPRRMDEKVTLGVEPSRFTMEMSMQFSGFNEPVDIPEPPVNPEPLDLEDMGGP